MSRIQVTNELFLSITHSFRSHVCKGLSKIDIGENYTAIPDLEDTFIDQIFKRSGNVCFCCQLCFSSLTSSKGSHSSRRSVLCKHQVHYTIFSYTRPQSYLSLTGCYDKRRYHIHPVDVKWAGKIEVACVLQLKCLTWKRWDELLTFQGLSAMMKYLLDQLKTLNLWFNRNITF